RRRRVSVHVGWTSGEGLARRRDRSLAARSNQDIPLQAIVEAVNPARLPGRNPLFQVSFVWQNTPQPKLELPGLSVESIPVHPGGAKVDLALEMEESADGIAASFEYRRPLFDARTVAALASQFKELLRDAIGAPDTCVRDLRVLSDESRAALVAMSTGQLAADTDVLLHELVERQAATTSDAIALV